MPCINKRTYLDIFDILKISKVNEKGNGSKTLTINTDEIALKYSSFGWASMCFLELKLLFFLTRFCYIHGIECETKNMNALGVCMGFPLTKKVIIYLFFRN